MPESVPGITFNGNGVCSFCQDFKPITLLGEGALQKIIEHARSLHRPYDAIVPISGGRDSSYVLYLAKARFGLKVIAVNYDSEFRSEQAVRNMENARIKLDIDFISIRSKHALATRYVLNTLKAAGSPREFNICGTCGYGNKAAVWSVAKKYQAPLILWGGSSVEYTPNMVSKIWPHLPRTSYKHRRFCNIHFYLAEWAAFLHRMEFPLPGHSPFSRRLAIFKSPGIVSLSVYDYIPWERQTIKETIQNELDWKKPPDHVSSWRIDCKLDRIVTFEFFRLFGCSKHCFGYTQMINSRQMTREEALIQEETMAAAYLEGMDGYLIEELGLTKKQALRILSF